MDGRSCEMPELDPDDVKTAAGYAGGGTMVLVIIVAIKHFFSNAAGIVTAGTAWGQSREGAASRLMREAFAERDRAQRDTEEMERERDHWRDEAYRVQDEYRNFVSECRARGVPCHQDPPLIRLQTYRPPKPAPEPATPPTPQPPPLPPTASQETPKP